MINRRKFVALSGLSLALASSGVWFNLRNSDSVEKKSFSKLYKKNTKVLLCGKGHSFQQTLNLYKNTPGIQLAGVIPLDPNHNINDTPIYSDFEALVKSKATVDVICFIGFKPGHQKLAQLKKFNADLWLDRPSDLDNRLCEELNQILARNNNKVLFTYSIDQEILFMNNEYPAV